MWGTTENVTKDLHLFKIIYKFSKKTVYVEKRHIISCFQIYTGTRECCDKERSRKSSVAVISSLEMYIRFRGVSLRYFACVLLNSSTIPGKKVHMIRAEMWGGGGEKRRKWRSSEMCIVLQSGFFNCTLIRFSSLSRKSIHASGGTRNIA